MADLPVSSESLFAALPVGAANAVSSPILSKRARIALTDVVFPVPGPPVRSNTVLRRKRHRFFLKFVILYSIFPLQGIYYFSRVPFIVAIPFHKNFQAL